MNQEKVIKHLISNPECFDRFTFDKYMRMLLRVDYTHDEAKDLILMFCSLSNIVFQERMENKYYLKINLNKLVADDLREFKEEIKNEILRLEKNDDK